MAIQILDYGEGNDFSIGVGAVSFQSGIGAQILAAPLLRTFNQDFSSDTGFIFDPTKAEFDSGLLRQLTQRPANSHFAAIFDQTINASWSDAGTLAPIATVNNPTIGPNGLDLRDNKSATYDSSNCYSPITGAIKFELTPDYSGTPAEINQIFFFENADTAGADRLWLQHENQGFLRIDGSTENGSGWQVYTFATWAPVAGQTYEIEFNWDFVSGDMRLFIDGVQLGSTGNRNGSNSPLLSSSTLRIGGSVGSTPSFQIKNIIIFDAVQHTADYTPGYSLPAYEYTENVVELPDFIYDGIGSIQSYLSIAMVLTGAVRATINDQYWTGAIWDSSSDTYATASSQADINANLASFPTVIDVVSIKLIFSSSNTQESISNLDFNYNGVGYAPVNRADSNIVNNMDALTSFILGAGTLTPFGTSILFIINAGNSDYWFNQGSSLWELSDGTEDQANDIATINANVGSFPLQNGKAMFVKTFLLTNDDQATPLITTLTYQFSFTIPSFVLPPEIQLYGIILKGDRTAAVNSKLVIEYETTGVGSPYIAEDSIVRPFRLEVLTDGSGQIEQDLIPSQPYGKKYKFTLYYTLLNETEETSEFWGFAEVPNQSQVNVNTLTFTETA